MNQFSKIVFILFLIKFSLFSFSINSDSSVEKINAQLDSIEFLIQENRRAGKSIYELSKQYNELKKELELSLKNPTKQKKSNTINNSKSNVDKKPQVKNETKARSLTIIDILIMIVGAIAIASAIAFIVILILVKVRGKKTSNKPKVKPVKYGSNLDEGNEQSTTEEESEPIATPGWVNSMREKSSSDLSSSKKELLEKLKDLDSKKEPPVENNESKIEIPTEKANIIFRNQQTTATVDTPPRETTTEIITEKEIVENNIDKTIDEVAESLPNLLEEDTSNISEEIGNESIREIESILSSLEEEISVVEEEVVKETPKKDIKEQIIDDIESGMAVIDVAKKYNKSIGEIDLIVSFHKGR